MSRRGTRMLVVTANWGIPDGSVSAPPPNWLFQRLFADTCRAAVRAGFRFDGRYRPVERVALVLAGDTFDGLLSDRWLGAVRPWERRREAAARHGDVFHAAWKNARRPFAAVRRLAGRGIAVPAAGPHGRPLPKAFICVPVHVVMLAGDRDATVERLARELPPDRLSIGVGNAWDGDGVHVVHGAAGDPLAARETGPTIIESLAVDLLARFGAAVVARGTFGDRGRRLVRDLAAGRPLDMPRRLRAAVRQVTDDETEAEWAVGTWRRSADRWAMEARRRGCPAADHGAVDAIASWMHAIEPGQRPGPGACRVIADLVSPLPLGVDGRTLTVAGHPGPVGRGVESPVVCLGPPAVDPDVAVDFRAAGPGAVSCIEAGPAVGPASLPAVAIFEAGEGGGRRLEWFTASEAGHTRQPWSGAVPVLDAA